jgi:hypothetical protein
MYVLGELDGVGRVRGAVQTCTHVCMYITCGDMPLRCYALVRSHLTSFFTQSIRWRIRCWLVGIWKSNFVFHRETIHNAMEASFLRPTFSQPLVQPRIVLRFVVSCVRTRLTTRSLTIASRMMQTNAERNRLRPAW